jgi:hypothetical protein
VGSVGGEGRGFAGKVEVGVETPAVTVRLSGALNAGPDVVDLGLKLGDVANLGANSGKALCVAGLPLGRDGGGRALGDGKVIGPAGGEVVGVQQIALGEPLEVGVTEWLELVGDVVVSG